MRWILVAVGCLAGAGAAEAQFAGGFADGMQQAQQIENLRRAQQLDATDGGRRYESLRTQQQLDDIKKELKKNNELLESERMRRLTIGKP